MDSPFKILIAAIIVIAILIIAVNLFFLPSEDTLKEIENAVDYAEANEGLLHPIDLLLKKDFYTQALLLDLPSRNVRFKCNSSEVCSEKSIKVEARSFFVKKQFSIKLFFRCKKKELIYDCVVYIGEEPAQLELKLINVPEELDKGETSTIGFTVKNIGYLDAVGASYKGIIFQKKKDETGEKLLAIDGFEGEIERLQRGDSQNISEQIKINSSGEYLLKLTADGEDSGIAFAEHEFTVNESISANCKTESKKRSVYDNGVCKTNYTCSGCEESYECAFIWEEKGIKGIDSAGLNKARVEEQLLREECV